MEQDIPKKLNAQQIMIAIITLDLSLDSLDYKKRISLLPLIVTGRSQSPVAKHAPHNRPFEELQFSFASTVFGCTYVWACKLPEIGSFSSPEFVTSCFGLVEDEKIAPFCKLLNSKLQDCIL